MVQYPRQRAGLHSMTNIRLLVPVVNHAVPTEADKIRDAIVRLRIALQGRNVYNRRQCKRHSNRRTRTLEKIYSPNGALLQGFVAPR